MPRITAPLTDAKLRNLKPRERPYEVSDGGHPGLKVEVQPSGAKIWRYRYMLHGRREKLTIGEMGLAAARARYNDAKALVAAGTSPAAEKQKEKAKAGDEEATVKGFFEHRFIPDHLSKLKSRKAVERLLRKEMLPYIGRLNMDRVTTEDVERITDRIKTAGHDPTALLVRAWMSSMFELAVDRRRIESNPVKQIKRKRIGKPASRNRVMTPAQLGIYLSALLTPSASVSEKHRKILELILMTSCRRAEAASMERHEIDIPARTWTIPPAKSKSEIEHRIYLSDRALALVQWFLSLDNPRWVIPSDRDPTKPVHPETLNSARRRLVRESEALKAVPHFGMHDGRRSFSTWAHENLEHPDVVEACLGHTIKGVRGIYARPQFESARRRLMQAWQDHLDGTVHT